MSETNKHCFVRTLREIAEFVESRPFSEDLDYWSPYYYIECENAAEFGAAVAAAGSFEKSDSDDYLKANIRFGSSTLQIFIEKEKTCRRVKVGEKVIPATEEFTTAAEPEHTEDVFKYECPPSFLALQDGHAMTSESEVPA